MAKRQRKTTTDADQAAADPPPPLGVDPPEPKAPADADQAAADPPAHGRQTAAPVCPIHKEPCVAGRSAEMFTYYYCRYRKTKNCKFSIKQQRPHAGRPTAAPPADYSAR